MSADASMRIYIYMCELSPSVSARQPSGFELHSRSRITNIRKPSQWLTNPTPAHSLRRVLACPSPEPPHGGAAEKRLPSGELWSFDIQPGVCELTRFVPNRPQVRCLTEISLIILPVQSEHESAVKVCVIKRFNWKVFRSGPVWVEWDPFEYKHPQANWPCKEVVPTTSTSHTHACTHTHTLTWNKTHTL